MYIHRMKFSLEVVSIKVISFMKIKRKGFVMKGGETRSPPGSVSRVNVSSVYWPLMQLDFFFSELYVKTTSS